MSALYMSDASGDPAEQEGGGAGFDRRSGSGSRILRSGELPQRLGRGWMKGLDLVSLPDEVCAYAALVYRSDACDPRACVEPRALLLGHPPRQAACSNPRRAG
jgi:hypothetical protein